MSINPFDEIALEEALRIRERDEANEVVTVTIGSADAQQQLRTGLAMGADRAILVAAPRGRGERGAGTLRRGGAHAGVEAAFEKAFGKSR